MTSELLLIEPKPKINDLTEQFTLSVQETNTSLSGDASQIFEKIYNPDHNVFNYATLERNEWKLNGSVDIWDNNISYISNVMSETVQNNNGNYYLVNKSGVFSPQTIMAESSQQNAITTSGITIIFAGVNCRCVEFNVDLFDENYNLLRGIRVINNNDNIVTVDFGEEISFSKLAVTLIALNKPNCFAKVNSILNGKSLKITEDNILSSNILKNSSLTSEKLPMDTFEATVEIPNNSPLVENQIIKIFHQGGNIGTYYLQDFENTYIRQYDLYAVDCLTKLENLEADSVFFQDKLVGEAIAEIFELVGINFNIQEAISQKKISGHQKTCSLKDRLKQILMASCAVLVIDEFNIPNIIELSNTIKTKFDESEVYEGTIISQVETYNKIILDVHYHELTYKPTCLYYEGGVRPSQDNTFISKLFDNPIYIGEWNNNFLGQEGVTVAAGGAIRAFKVNQFGFSGIKRYDENYTVSGGTVWVPNSYGYESSYNVRRADAMIVWGYPYQDNITQKTLELPPTKKTENLSELKLDDLRFVYEHNSDDVLEFIKKEHFNKKQLKFMSNIKNINCGDYISAPTEWQGVQMGHVESIEYSLGNKLIGEVTMRIDD